MKLTKLMKPKRITKRLLKKMGACVHQVELFQKEFPRGCRISAENAVKADMAKLDIYWLMITLMRRYNRGVYIDFREELRTVDDFYWNSITNIAKRGSGSYARIEHVRALFEIFNAYWSM